MNKLERFLIGLFISLALFYIFKSNFLLFHSLIELISIIIAFNIFIIGWNSRNFTDNTMLLLLGVAYLSVGILDSLHMLAFDDMGIYANIVGYNITCQLWIGARFLESISLVLAAIISITNKKYKAKSMLFIYLATSALVIYGIFKNEIFPTCFIKGVGLTPFKIYSEYLVCVLIIISGIIFWKYRTKINLTPGILIYLLISLILTVFSEICFTLYENIFCHYQYWGHIFKLFSFYFLYKALIEESLKKPYSNLFNSYNTANKKLIATGSMMSTMLHDIKNPLTNIRALGQLGNKTTDSARDKGYYKKIIYHVDNITEMLNKTMHVFDSENMKEINPARLLKEILKEIKPLCRGNNIKLTVDIQDINCNVLLEGNLFKRVIYNLVNNAVNVLDEGDRIKIHLEETKKNVLISINDNGPGIPPDIQENIFEPYKTKKGTGLGLYMVNFAVSEVFGGQVWFETEKNIGTTFCIELPKTGSDSLNYNFQENITIDY